MDNEALEELIRAGIPGCEVKVDGDGRHFRAVVVSDAFDGLSLVKQHQLVYRALGDLMKERVHALSIDSYTPEAWARQSKLQVLG